MPDTNTRERYITLSLWVIFCLVSIKLIIYSVKYQEELNVVRRIQKSVSPAISCIDYLFVYPGSYSRTYNKSTIYLKVRRPDGTFYGDHTLRFVLLHEVSHIICEVSDYGKQTPHSEDFHKVFDKVRELAYDAGVLEKRPIDPTY